MKPSNAASDADAATPRELPEGLTADRLAELLELTQLPTAAGREGRVIRWITRWADARPYVRLSRDPAGNLVLTRAEHAEAPSASPVWFTAHLDHPAFVVDAIPSSTAVHVTFRGGVRPEFFNDAPITLHTKDDRRLPARLAGEVSPQGAKIKTYRAELESGAATDLTTGDVGTWRLPAAHVDSQGVLHTNACDDLAAVAAALHAFDRLLLQRAKGEPTEDVRVLFTRAEEIGFIGAIAACRHGTLPAASRIIALENSRAFPEAPIGAGPIVRVGDRLSLFSPALTDAICRRAEEVFRVAASPRASDPTPASAPRPWQRKLMAGGACEATVFCTAGLDATCLCLPLGNYHNMPHLDLLQAGAYDPDRLGPPRCAPEFISLNDYQGLVDLLVAVGMSLPEASSHQPKMDKLYEDYSFVLGEQPRDDA